MVEYTVIYEHANDGGWGAYPPDFSGPGLVVDTREEAHRLIVEGVALRMAGLVEDGLPVPKPTSYAGLVAVQAA